MTSSAQATQLVGRLRCHHLWPCLAFLACVVATPATVLAHELVAPVEGGGLAGGSDAGADAASEAGFTEEELDWASIAWAYFASPTAVAPPASEDGSAAPPPAATLLVPTRGGTNVATAWSIGDQVAALVIARRLGLIDAREFDRRFSRLVDYLSWMPLGPDGMPNRFYDTTSGASLGGDLQPGIAGWSAVDTGRLLLWLRIASEAHPEFRPFVRNAVSRFSVCAVRSPEGRLQSAIAAPEGAQYVPETGRGYDAYAAQGYRAWGLDLPLPEAAASPSEIEIEGVRFPVSEDIGNQAPVLTTPPAYLGLELGFEPIGGTEDEVAGGRTARDLMEVVHAVQESRFANIGQPTARADFRRGEDPTTILGTILASGSAWSVTDQGGALRSDLALVSTRAVFALDAFYDDAYADALRPLVRELRESGQGWFEGRYEASGAWETTRTSATNAFVLEALAYHRLGVLFPDEARPDALGPAVVAANGACRLPLAVTSSSP